MHDLSIFQLLALGVFALIVALGIFAMFVRLGCRTWFKTKREFEESLSKEKPNGNAT